MDRFYVKISLAVISNTKKGAFILLDENGALPNDFLAEDHNFEDVLHGILYKYAGLSPYWAQLSPVCFQNSEDTLECLYSTFIPEPTDIKVQGSKWINCLEADISINKVIWTKRG